MQQARWNDIGKRRTPVDAFKLMKDAGWTAADFRNAERLAEIHALGGEGELVAEVMRRHRTSELAASRAVLRRRRQKQ